jgi:tetratricopeptide (TPR) repeat protein
MLRNRLLINFFVLSVVIGAPAFAQTNPNALGHDYFTADQDGIGNYLRVMTGAHINTIPNWIKQGRITDAVADIKYSLDRFPNHPQALQLLPLVARLANNQALAGTYFEKAVTQFPQYALTQAQYGLFLVSIGNLDDGIGRLNRSIEMDPKLPAGYAGLAHAYAKKGDIAKAREATDKARELGFTGRLPPGL